jgi:hypothetical protein
MLGGFGAGFLEGGDGVAEGGRFALRRGDVGTAFHGCDAAEAFLAGEVGGEAFEGKIFLEREVGIAVPHEDAAQVGMAGEVDAHHVIDFALMPVGALVDGDDRVDGVVVLADFDFDAKMALVVRAAERCKFVDDFKAGFIAEMVDAGNIKQEIVAEAFEVGGRRSNDLAVDLHIMFVAEFLPLTDFAGELLLQRGDGVRGGHEGKVLTEFTELGGGRHTAEEVGRRRLQRY